MVTLVNKITSVLGVHSTIHHLHIGLCVHCPSPVSFHHHVCNGIVSVVNVNKPLALCIIMSRPRTHKVEWRESKLTTTKIVHLHDVPKQTNLKLYSFRKYT